MNVGTKIQLKQEYAGIYPHAEGGATGWVADSKMDEVDFEFIRVKWDRDDWRTADEQEGWTFPQHFDVIEDHASSEQVLDQTFQLIQDNMNHDPQPEQTAQIEGYVDALMQAQHEAGDADGFMMIVVKKYYGPDDNVPTYIPETTIAAQSPESEAVIKLHILQMAMGIQQDTILRDIGVPPDEDEDEGDESGW